MNRITVKIEGMMCEACERRVNEAVKREIPVKNVTSSHLTGETVILTDADISEQRLKEVVEATGYEFKSCQTQPYVKRGLFGRR